MVGEEDPVSKYFPWEIVEQSLQDPQLEQFQGVKEEYLVEAKSCPNCEAPPDELRWVYVREAPQPSDRPGAHSHRDLFPDRQSSSSLVSARSSRLRTVDYDDDSRLRINVQFISSQPSVSFKYS